MSFRPPALVSVLACLGLLAACAQPAPDRPAQLFSEIYDMTDAKFTVRSIAPTNQIQELVICKAVWFAEKRHVATFSLSNPAYSKPTEFPLGLGKVPEGWAGLTATAYVTGPNPDGNPSVAVAEKASECRATWSWYR